jgi:hypothetical protein
MRADTRLGPPRTDTPKPLQKPAATLRRINTSPRTILVPVAFAATLLLSRDSSTLSARLRRIRQSILMVELFALLSLAFTMFVAHFIHLD